MKIGFLFLAVLSVQAMAQTNPDIPGQELLTEKYLEEISKREVGQTAFAVKESMHYRMSTARGGAPATNEMQEESREIQESDVYKLGKEGQKELLLLNRHRGLQIVSFKDGLERPQIVGRIPVFNNWNSEMYFLQKENKILVVNTEYSYNENYWRTNYNTVLYLIDVADSTSPKIIKELEVPGYLEQSRMVGDVLYTVTNSGNWNEMKAQITSVKLSGDTISTVANVDLHGKDRWVRTMNVVKEGKKYYVISTQSNWNRQGDTVNVHDITSEKGSIEKVATYKARGQISERSQTFVHKNHLFAVSNYQENENARLRVSVEAYPLKKSEEVVSATANMRVSVGDTNGQHASLQDVRVSGDMLYAFWVPANNIDPFDLFDISEPSKGIKHLGQLQFDGWISKAFPIDHDNRKFVLGLGWIIPATAENGRRYPQAKLFEIKKSGNTVKHEVVASLTLDSADVWASLNDEDKMFEIMQEASGVFNIMFPVTFTKTWKSGAKIVTADLNKEILEEGASIVADQGWLSRVFSNKEIRAVSSFSDMSLETFDGATIAAKGVVKAVSVLELARNIVDFRSLSNTEGVQIIEGEKAVEVRHVSLKNVDAEKADVTNMVSIPGKYHWHKIQDGKLFVITAIHKKTKHETYGYEYDQFEKANLNVLDLASDTVTVKKIDVTHGENQHYWFNIEATSTSKQDLFTIGSELFKLSGNSLTKLEVADDCKYFFKTDSRQASLNVVADELLAFNAFRVSTRQTSIDETVRGPWGPYHRGVSFTMPFVKKLAIINDTVACSKSVNVPGTPVLLNDKFMVSDAMGSRYWGPMPIHYSYGGMNRHWNSSNKTFSLKVNSETQVEMADILEKDITSGLFKDGFVTYSNEEARLDLWTLGQEGEFLSKPQYLSYRGSKDSSIITVKEVGKRNFIFMKNEKKVDLFEIAKNKKVSKVNVTSTHDLNKEDGSAEFIFAINAIDAAPDLSKFHISQGLHGMTEIILK